MLDFAVVFRKKPLEPQHADELVNELPSLRSARTDSTYSFTTPSIRAWAWHTAVQPYLDPTSTIRTSQGFRLYTGYAMTQRGRPIASLDMFKPDEEYRGDFLHLQLDEHGTGRLVRSDVSNQQVYYAESDRWFVLSSRATMAAVLIHNSLSPAVNPAFVRWVCSYGVCSNRDALFRSVRILQLDESLKFEAGKVTIHRRGPSFLFSNELKSLYAADRRAYWDRAFEQVRDSVNCIEMTDDPIEFPLSGGKDSRLLLALLIAGNHADRIGRIYTNGPSVSPEVRSARDVCEMLALPHEFVDNSTAVQAKDIILSDKLMPHLLISEGELSPMDLFWQRTVQRRTMLHGQEGGLRNIAGKRTFADRQEVLAWFGSHLGSGDMCKIYRPGVGEVNLAEIGEFVDHAAAAGVDWSDIPSLHRVSFRLARWVSRTWKAYNEISFAPYIFVNADVISATLSAGHWSRIIEEFHFEMLRRVNPKLLTVPFAGQQWNPEVTARSGLAMPTVEPYHWSDQVPLESRRATHEAFARNLESIVTFITKNAGSVVQELVDMSKLAKFVNEGMLPGHFQPLWQLLQCTIAERVPSWNLLADNRFLDQFQLPEVDVRAQ